MRKKISGIVLSWQEFQEYGLLKAIKSRKHKKKTANLSWTKIMV